MRVALKKSFEGYRIMLTSNIRKTVLAVAALALCPSFAFAQAGTAPAKPMTTTTMSTEAAQPASAKTTVAKANTHNTPKVSQLVKHKHHRMAARTKAKVAKTASVSADTTLKAKTAAK
jgi:hypothetical protein